MLDAAHLGHALLDFISPSRPERRRKDSAVVLIGVGRRRVGRDGNGDVLSEDAARIL